MNIHLKKAGVSDAKLVHEMQVKAFMPLLKKYEDYHTNPGSETIETVIQKLEQSYSDYYIIMFNNTEAGGIRIVRLKEGTRCRISPIFILPEFQGRGVAQEVILLVEEMYSPSHGWELDTALQEQGNCYLYEKMGYKKTGEIKVVNDKITLVSYEK